MSNSESLSKHPSDNKLSPFSLKTNQPFISLIKNLIKTKAVSPSNNSKGHSISNINLNTKMKSKINLHSNKVSLSNLFSSNCNSNSNINVNANGNSNHHRNDIISPVKDIKKPKQKVIINLGVESLSDMPMPNSCECIQSYDHISLKDKDKAHYKNNKCNKDNNDDTLSMNSINKYISYSDLSSIMHKGKIQRIEKQLSKNTIEANSQSTIKQNCDMYINIFNDIIDLITPSTPIEHQMLLIKLKEGIDHFFMHMIRKLNETEEEVALYKKESNYNKRLCEKYSNIIKEYQKKTQETEYKIQLNNNHMLIDDNEDTTTYNNSCYLFNKSNKQVIVNNQSSLCSRNQSNAANNNNNNRNNKTDDDNMSRDFSTKELESVCFADKVTMVKMNSLLNIPKLNFQKCKHEGQSMSNH